MTASSPDRLPWEWVETFPTSGADQVDQWTARVAGAATDRARARALVGEAIARYWAVSMGVESCSLADSLAHRRGLLDEAATLARAADPPDVDLLAEVLLGRLYALWGPDAFDERADLVAELLVILPDVADLELRLRIWEWVVLASFDDGDLVGAADAIDAFLVEAAPSDMVLFHRREVLWRANAAMLEGRIDDALRLNQDIISATAGIAGAPFSFQNVAITLAIERFFRGGLGDVVETVRSIMASSPRVATNWETGLVFSLSESGSLDEAATHFEALAVDDFARVPRDLNWLVTMQLLGLVAVTLNDRDRCRTLVEHLAPFASYDATHGSGYASYGPVGRVVGRLHGVGGDVAAAREVLQQVLDTRPPGPWTSLTRYDLAVVVEAESPAQARELAERAAGELRGFGADHWAARARALHERLAAGDRTSPTARLVDGRWHLHHPRGSADLPATVGLEALLRLLARPGQAVAAAALESRAAPVDRDAPAERTLDAAARSAYRRRIEELESRRRRSAADEQELDFLRRELGQGSYATSVSREQERARVRVTKAIHRALTMVEQASPGLGRHLRDSISTGTRCLYAPTDGVAWTVERAAD